MAKIIGNTTATPNPRPDWAQTDSTKADYIKNKPTILTEDEIKDLIDEFGGDSQVQADFNQTDETQLDYIKNKPPAGKIFTTEVNDDVLVLKHNETICEKGDKGDPGSVPIVQTTGDSETEVMSQKAVTENLYEMACGIAKENLLETDFAYNNFINGEGGVMATENARAAYTAYVPMIKNNTVISVAPGWKYNIALYNQKKTFYSYTTYSENIFVAPISGYFRFTLSKTDATEFDVADAVSAISIRNQDRWWEDKNEDISSYTLLSGAYINGSGYTGSTDTPSLYSDSFIPITKGAEFRVADGWKFNYALYSESELASFLEYRTYDTEPFVSEINGYIRFTLRREDNAEFEYEEGIGAITLTQRKAITVEDLYKAVSATNQTTVSNILPIGLHKMPSTQGVLNVIKRARQMTDFEWVPISDLIRISTLTGNTYAHSPVFQDVFSANKKYTGIPYTNASYHASNYGYSRMFVGSISLETFASAVRASDSAVALESYYDGQNNGTFYGAICSSFVCYALGVEPCFTSNFINIPGMVNKGKLINGSTRFDVKKLELADIIIYPGQHVAIITDIITDENGDVQMIELSETTKYGNANSSLLGSEHGSLTRRKGWTVNDFFNWFKNYNVYHYGNIDSVTYEPTTYSPMVDEFNMMPLVDFPCLPYMGNKFVYRKGYIPNSDILVLCKGFSYLHVKKDGVDFNVDGNGGLYEVAGETVAVGFTEPGFYEAYLCNVMDGVETTISASCQWRVSDADIAFSGDGDITFTITTDGNDIPKAVGFAPTDSYPNYPWNDVLNDDMTVTDNGDGTYTYTFTLTEPTWAGAYCKVAFKNEYGVWYSDTLTY